MIISFWLDDINLEFAIDYGMPVAWRKRQSATATFWTTTEYNLPPDTPIGDVESMLMLYVVNPSMKEITGDTDG